HYGIGERDVVEEEVIGEGERAAERDGLVHRQAEREEEVVLSEGGGVRRLDQLRPRVGDLDLGGEPLELREDAPADAAGRLLQRGLRALDAGLHDAGLLAGEERAVVELADLVDRLLLLLRERGLVDVAEALRALDRGEGAAV